MPLLLKFLLVPSLIAAVTLAGRRWGPQVAGWLSAFPIVSGPILLAIALEQGSDFAATAAANTLLAVLAILVFSVAYARVARHRGVLASMSAALLAWALAVAMLRSPALDLPLWAGFAAVLAALLAAPRLIGHIAERKDQQAVPARDLPWRMAAGALLTLGVTAAAAEMGPRLSGMFAMFPVMSTVLVGFSHRSAGPGFAVDLLRGMVRGYYAFAVFCLVLALLLRAQPLAPAFLAATACALTVQLGLRAAVARSGKRA